MSRRKIILEELMWMPRIVVTPWVDMAVDVFELLYTLVLNTFMSTIYLITSVASLIYTLITGEEVTTPSRLVALELADAPTSKLGRLVMKSKAQENSDKVEP